MNTYPLAVTSSSRRLMLVIGLLLIGVVFLFPTKPVETRASSAQPEQNLAPLKLAYSQVIHVAIGGNFINVLTANADGSGRAVIGPDGAYDPAWSPDGTKIVYCLGCYANGINAGGELYSMNADGTNPINLTNTPMMQEANPTWSVTGKIAYDFGVFGSSIWMMNKDGTGKAPFPGITRPAALPAWSPDGSKLAFSSNGEIWVINADGTNERRVTTSGSVPAWSPDGLKIAFSRGGIFVINADGTNEMRLTSENDSQPSWSPDNTKIAFFRNISPNGIFVMNTDGTNQIRIIVGSSNGGEAAHPAWQPLPLPPGSRPRFDFDGDNKADFAVYNPGSTPTAPSYWHILRSSNNSYFSTQFGSGEDKIVPADYNGDGSTDVAVYRPSTGTWYTSPDPSTSYGAVQWGIEGDIPIPGDFDGDGKADHAVFRPSDGVWYIINSSDGSFVGRQFGSSTDKPLLMDYDGDRKTDLAFLRAVGTDYYWFILQSSNNTAVVPRLGVVGDMAVPADYDGDGRSNLAVYKPETRTWIILNADGNGTVEQQWGQSGDMPAPGDFDGDGKADFTIFRADGATWAVLRSVDGGIVSQQWGSGTSVPMTRAYIP